jgi:hypothetical protein
MSSTTTSTDPESAAPTLAVIGLSGHVLRYAEVAPAGPRLLRLGACDFETDAEAAVFGTADEATLAVLEDALRDVFAGSAARSLIVTVPATASTAFFTPLPAGLAAADRDDQIRQEAALLADIPPAAPVRVRAVPVRAEAVSGPEGSPGADGVRLWYHVLHVSEGVHARLGRLAAAIGVASYDVADAGRGAAAVVRALPVADAPAHVSLIVGAYADHTEAVVVRGGELVFGHHGPGTTPEDTAYYALAALEAAGHDAAAVGRVFATGDAVDPDRLAVLGSLTGHDAAPLNPIGLFGRPVDAASAWELAAFAPVLGAALAAAVVEAPAAEPPAGDAPTGGAEPGA